MTPNRRAATPTRRRVPRRIRVAIIDDHPVVQGGLLLALAATGDIEVVGVAAKATDARTLLATHPVDVALLDVRLADGSGLDLLAEQTPGRPAWVILSSFDLPQYVERAVRLGAAGYLLKTAPMADLLAAVRRAAAGLVTFDARHLELARQAAGRRLTLREREIVRAIIAGRSNEEIGRDLGLQRKTVETYLTRLYERTNCASRAELAARAVGEGWLET